MDGITPKQRRDDFWRPYMRSDTIYESDPADGHRHDFAAISPKTLGNFGPTCIACLACGWVKSWGAAT